MKKKVQTLVSITCDACNKVYDDEFDYQEFLFIDFIGGYSSVFGDETHVQSDICQDCVKTLLTPVLRFNEGEND